MNGERDDAEDTCDDEFCGLDGDEDGFVTRREINRLLRLLYRYHVRPIKRDVANISRAVLDPKHGLQTLRRFIIWMGVGIVAILAGVMRVIEFMRNMGAL